jgi:hypothetical protein
MDGIIPQYQQAVSGLIPRPMPVPIADNQIVRA